MGRTAKSLSLSATPDDLARWEHHEQRFAGRSALWRHTIDLLDREELLTELRRLQDVGDAAVARQGLAEEELDALLRQVSDLPEDELDDTVVQLVDLITSGSSAERPQRTRTPMPDAVLDDERRATDA